MEIRDLRIAEALLSPEYMIPLAREHGEGDPVRGARGAWLEVRGILREWVRHVRQRDREKLDLDTAFSFKHLGIIGTYCDVIEVNEERWRKMAIHCWNSPAVIQGKVKVKVETDNQQRINCSALRAISKALRDVPLANRALLDGRCWQRVSSEILLNFELKGEMHSVVFDATDRTDLWLSRRIRRATSAARHMQRHELAWFGAKLAAKWAKSGLISSPAGAMVSLMGTRGLYSGYAPVLPGNGVPTTIVVCTAMNNQVVVTGSFDHRVMDGRATTGMLNTIREEMECELS